MRGQRVLLASVLMFSIVMAHTHPVKKRGLIASLFGEQTDKSNDGDKKLSPNEESGLEEILKNSMVASMLNMALKNIVQQINETKNITDLCSNRFIRLAHTAASGVHPSFQTAIRFLGCDEEKTTPAPTVNADADNELGVTSFLQTIVNQISQETANIYQGFLDWKDQLLNFKSGDRLPSTSYQLDEADTNVLKVFPKKVSKK